VGGGGKKGASGSVDVDVDSDSDSSTVLDIVGLDDVNITSATSSTNRLEVPDQIRTRMEMAITEPLDTRFSLSVPDTIRTERRSEMVIEPIRTDTRLAVDVEPVVLDLCLTVGIKDPPRFCVSRPYDRRVQVNVLGREILGLHWSGDRKLVVDDVRSRPHVAGRTEQRQDGDHGHGSDDHSGRGKRERSGDRREELGDPGRLSREGRRGVRVIL
jgi:hypothetical protein